MTDSAPSFPPAVDGSSDTGTGPSTETGTFSSPEAIAPSTSKNLTQPKNTSSSATSPAARVALVTGAAQGIGRAIALRFAQDGYKIAICDLPSQVEKLQELEREISEIRLLTTERNFAERPNGSTRHVGEEGKDEGDGEKNVVVLFADVSKEEDVRTAVDECVRVLGGLDVMVANAGIAVYKPLLELPVEEFDSVVAVNLRGAMLCYKYAAQQMVKQGRGGRIIGASSMYGKAGAPNLAGYSASKFGIRGLTHTAALEWGKHGITVNAYAPAGIRTPMLEEYESRLTSAKGMNKGEFLEQIGSRSAVGYLGESGDVASLVGYLASPEAHFITELRSRYLFATNVVGDQMAGQTISVDGGSFVD